MSMRTDAVVVPLSEAFPEEIGGVKITTKGVLGPNENEGVERESIASSTTGVVDSVVDTVVNGVGHTLVSPSSTEGVTTEDNSVEEVESPSETTAAASNELSDETKAAIVKQAEFYFSDENLPTDAFMKKKLKAGGAQGWVPVKVIAGFPKMRKLSKNAKAIGSVLDALSDKLVVQGSRVRRKTPFVLDKEGTADVASRTVVAVNIPANSTIESLTPFFSACGVAEAVRIIRDEGQNSKGKEIHAPVGPHRKFYATCQYSTLEEAIRAVNELTDRSSWRGGLRVTLANGLTVEKALARMKSSGGKKSKPEREGRSPPGREAISPRPKAHDHKGKRARNVRKGQTRSRSLTELELEAVASSTRAAPKVGSLPGNQTNSVQGKAHEDARSSGGDGSDIPNGTVCQARKLRSVSNVDAASMETRGGGGSGGFEEISPPRHNNTSSSDVLLRKGVVQTISFEGCSWIKKDGNGSRKGGGRIPFWMADVVNKDGEQQQQHPLQKGDHVEFRTWRGNDGKVVAVRVERIKERSRAVGSNGANGNGGGSGFRATQAHFRMAIGPEEGQSGFAVGRGRRIRGSSIGGPDTKEFIPAQLGGLSGGVNQRPRGSSVGGVAPAVGDDNVGIVRRPRGSSMGGPESMVFVPGSFAASRFEDSD